MPVLTSEQLRTWRTSRLTNLYINNFLVIHRGILTEKQVEKKFHQRKVVDILRERMEQNPEEVLRDYDFIRMELHNAVRVEDIKRIKEYKAMKEDFLSKIARLY